MSKALNLLLARLETLAVEKADIENKLIDAFNRHEDELRSLRDDVEYHKDRINDLEWDLRRERGIRDELQSLPGFQEFVAAAKKAKEDAFVARMNATARENFDMVLSLGKLDSAKVKQVLNTYNQVGKINAIKEARLAAGVGLKEAKDFCEVLGTLNNDELEFAYTTADNAYKAKNPPVPDVPGFN